MYIEEYPDLIYEGLISQDFFIVEEGLGESIKNGLTKLRTMIKTVIDKIIEKWKWLMGKIRQGINKIKEKNKKGNNTNKENNKVDTNNEDINATSKSYGTVKYKFKSKDYIKEFDDEYNKVSKYIDDIVECVEYGDTADSDSAEELYDGYDNAYEKLKEYENSYFPKSLDELKEKILDKSNEQENYEIDSEEIEILMQTKTRKI